MDTSAAKREFLWISASIFEHYYVDIDWNVLCCDIYCNLLNAVRLLWNNSSAVKTYKRSRIYVWCWSIMLAAAYYIEVWILFYSSKCFHGILRQKERKENEKKMQQRRFKIFAGSAMSDKNKRTLFHSFSASPRCQQCCPVCLCLLFVASDIFDDRLNSHIAFKLYSNLHHNFCSDFFWGWRFTTKRSELKSVPYWHFK